MGAFTTDQSLGQHDLDLLSRAVQGEKLALVLICRRFKIPVLAVAIRTGFDLDQAYESVEPVLTQLCELLLEKNFKPEQWPAELIAAVTARFHYGGNQDDATMDKSSLSDQVAIPRLARRRAVRMMLPKLSLPELTALLLQYMDGFTAANMVGLVAETEAEVAAILYSAHESIANEVRKDSAGSQE